MAKKIAITLGDPAGVGPEVIVKSLKELSLNEKKRIVIIGSSFVLDKIKGFKNAHNGAGFIDIDNLDKNGFSFGRMNASNAKASLEYLDIAVNMAKSKEISGIVTGPVSKYAIDLFYKGFRGQTEYIGRASNAKSVRMMILSSGLRFSLVTTHVALAQACRILSIANIFETISLTAFELKNLFNIPNPSIGVCGLNPHMGESGIIGREELDIIKPAIEEAGKKIKNLKVSGPLPLEKIVFSLKDSSISAGVCLYHDQAILPLKLLAPGEGVNLTLGLGFVRTSPLHGTAFDIAGKNRAKYASMLEAIKLTLRLAQRKKLNE